MIKNSFNPVSNRLQRNALSRKILITLKLKVDLMNMR